MDNNKTELEILRQQIDLIDKNIINGLAQRFNSVKKVALIKKDLGLQALDSVRWEAVLRSRIKLGQEQGLDAGFVREIYEAIHWEALKIENEKFKIY